MGYYIRILGVQDPDIHIDELIQSLAKESISANFEFNPNETPGKWTMLNILNQAGVALAQLERNPVIDGELGKDELEEFNEDIRDCEPRSAVTWLTSYFDKIKVIYAFQMLDAAFEDDNFEIISDIKSMIWNKTGGILQADNEGFSNDEGYHILWQFSDSVTGEWSCAVRNEIDQWDEFVMDLGDKIQRQEFQAGKVPKQAKRL